MLSISPFFLILGIIFFSIFITILIFSLFSIFYIIVTGVPWVKTPDKNIKKIFDNVDLPKGSRVYDLGCGDGRFLFESEKRGYQAMGFELYIYPYLKAVTKKKLTKSTIKIKRKNFFKNDLSDASLVFVFLVGRIMKKTEEKLKKELKSGSVVASYGFEFPNLKLEKVLDTYPSKTYFYKI